METRADFSWFSVCKRRRAIFFLYAIHFIVYLQHCLAAYIRVYIYIDTSIFPSQRWFNGCKLKWNTRKMEKNVGTGELSWFGRNIFIEKVVRKEFKSIKLCGLKLAFHSCTPAYVKHFLSFMNFIIYFKSLKRLFFLHISRRKRENRWLRKVPCKFIYRLLSFA